ncbi:proteoglycan 4 isoform X4 [Solenopsis invicta]|uniref:proteoglycan 4 isoform X4 n=1 Tax=Solenopsis invicta TaxID=13686 RepID=UPI00193CEC31|nr:proteoglycan 4 isoform X4 [Solenopsis invicta]
MSEKLPTPSTKSVGVRESKNIASKEACKKKEQTPKTKKEDAEMVKKVKETHEVKSSQNIMSKIFSFNKPEDPETTEISKAMSEISVSKRDDSEANEICHVLKDTSKISTSTKFVASFCYPEISQTSTSKKSDDSDKAKEAGEVLKDTSTSMKLEASEVSEIDETPKNTSEMSTSEKPDTSDKAKEACQVLKDMSEDTSTSPELEASKIPEVSQTSKTTSEMPTSEKSDASDKVKEVCQMLKDMSEDTSTSMKVEASKVPEVGETLKIAFEMFTSEKPDASDKAEEVCQVLKDTSKDTSTSTKLEASKVPEAGETLKTASEMFTFKKSGDSDKAKDVCQVLKDISEDTSTSAELEASKTPEVSQMPKTTSEMPTSEKSDASDKVKKVCQVLKDMSEDTSTSAELEASKTPEVSETPKTTSEMSTSEKSDASDKAKEVCQVLKDTSKDTSIFTKLEAPKVPEANQTPKTTSEMSTSKKSGEAKEICRVLEDTSKDTSTSTKLEVSKVPEVDQTPKTTSEMSTSEKPDASNKPKGILQVIMESSGIFSSRKSEATEVPKVDQMPKTTSEKSTLQLETSKTPEENIFQMPSLEKITSLVPPSSKSQVPEGSEATSISTNLEEPNVPEVCKKPKITPETSTLYEVPEVSELQSDSASEYTAICISKSKDETKSMEDVKGDDSENLSKKLAECSLKTAKDTEVDEVGKIVMIPIERGMLNISPGQMNMLQHKRWPPLSTPNLKERPLVLATYHMVPSLPIQLFEVLAEIIEFVTRKPVVLLHETRLNRQIPEFVDIAVMPAYEIWKDGALLPASFVFEHRLNKNMSPHVYADILVQSPVPTYCKEILSYRGHKCIVTQRRSQFTATGTLFKHLYAKGENLLFFSNLIEAKTELEVLEMMADRRADLAILESPVIRCNKHNVPGVESLNIFTTLGPLPPYRIMIKKSLEDKISEPLTNYLLNITKNKDWLDRLLPFGIKGFARNSTNNYRPERVHILKNVPYY